MAIILTPDEIPKYWEAIKYATVQSDMVGEDCIKDYLSHVLYLLLSSKASCLVRLGEDRRLQMIAILEITQEPVTGRRNLFIRNVYSFVKVEDAKWIDDFEHVKRFAKANNCNYITCISGNERVFEICDTIGMREWHRSFILEVSE